MLVHGLCILLFKGSHLAGTIAQQRRKKIGDQSKIAERKTLEGLGKSLLNREIVFVAYSHGVAHPHSVRVKRPEPKRPTQCVFGATAVGWTKSESAFVSCA